MPLGSLTGPLGKKRAGHLLRRACFGASLEDIDTFAELTAEEAFNQLLQDDLSDPAPPIDPLTGTEWVLSGTTSASSEESQLATYVNSWIIGQSMAPDVPDDQKLAYAFRERIVLFLHTLLTTQESVVNSSTAIYFQNALFRLYAFDQNDRTVADGQGTEKTVSVNLKELTKKVSVDNAMLVFLDGRYNVKGSPNENYARELLELFTIGRGLEGHVPDTGIDGDYYYYTETDVQQGAKVLSGFINDTTFSNLDEDTGLPRGIVRGGTVASSHDNTTKNFSYRMGNTVITPDTTLQLSGDATEASALDEISQLIDMIYSQEQTPIHICRRLYRFFIYHEVTEEIQEDVITEMAEIFVANDFKITPVLKALFTSSYFYEGQSGYTDDSFGSLIKSPFDLTVSFYKTLNFSIPGQSSVDDFYSFTGSLLTEIDNQGMNFYDPYEVAGYQAYHQYPIYNRSWITTNYLTNRYNFINERVSYGSGIEFNQVDIVEFVTQNIDNATARDAQALIIALVEYFLPVHEGLSFTDGTSSELTTERLNYFMNAFLYNPQIDGDPESAWTFRWDNNSDPEVTSNQLINLVNALMQSPEYQLM